MKCARERRQNCQSKELMKFCTSHVWGHKWSRQIPHPLCLPPQPSSLLCWEEQRRRILPFSPQEKNHSVSSPFLLSKILLTLKDHAKKNKLWEGNIYSYPQIRLIYCKRMKGQPFRLLSCKIQERREERSTIFHVLPLLFLFSCTTHLTPTDKFEKPALPSRDSVGR